MVARVLAARHLSSRDLATQLDADVEAVERFLRGGPVSRCLLDEIADALELDGVALERGEEKPVQRPSVFLRHPGVADFFEADRIHLDRALDDARTLRALRADLRVPFGLSDWSRPTVVAGPGATDAARQGYALARALRFELLVGAGPIVDLRRFAEERLGVVVEVAPLRSRSPAQAVLDRDAGVGAVVLNASDEHRAENPLLDRVHLAHELCHLLFDVTEPGRLHLVIERADDPGAEHLALEEARARGFAAEFLMPLRGIEELVGSAAGTDDLTEAYRQAALVRHRFETPWEITLRHLQNHGFLSPALIKDLLDHPGSPPPSSTTLPRAGAPSLALHETVLSALAAERVTEGEVRATLRLPPGTALPPRGAAA